MAEKEKKITITDVARMSGVSKGTVDRVVHNRGEVSDESKRKVLEIIDQIGYQPNIYASMLASKKRYNVICLIPQFEKGEYWSLVYSGIMRARIKAIGFNIKIDTVYYDQFSLSSFRQACKMVLDQSPSAVVLAPMFRDDTLILTNEFNQRGIPYVYIDSKLDGSNYLAYFGMPMHASGHLCASLLQLDDNVKEIANFRIDRGGEALSDPTINRREGFMDYLKENYPHCSVVNDFVKPYDELHNIKVLDSFFESHPDISHIVTFNSRAHLISDYLRKRDLKNMKLIGFDMLEKNVDALKDGYISVLIAQRTEMQVYRAINAIIDYLILHKMPTVRDNFMSMDILTKYNVEYYTDNIDQ